MASELNELAKKIVAQAAERRVALQQLLDSELNRTDRILAIRNQMGDSEAYVTSVSLSWLRTNVHFAHELPLFKEKHDPKTKKIAIDDQTIKLLSQRPISFSRQFPMAQYLIRRKSHKFPPILAVLNSPWVDDPEADEWVAQRAVRSVAEFEPLATGGQVGLLRVGEGFALYALDGQHRLLAVKGALELIETGTLEELRDNGSKTGNFVQKEDLQQDDPDLNESALQRIKEERIGLEILPAVMQGEARERSRERIRRIFVHVNRLAAPLDKGMMTVLDEDNGFRLVAKEIATTHPLFNSSDESLVEFERPNLTKSSKALTTLETLANGIAEYLEFDPPYDRWVPKIKGLVPERPEEEAIAEATGLMKEVFNEIAEIPIMKAVTQGALPRELREFTEEGGRKHLLMRPIAQQALLEALGYCHFKKEMPLTELFAKVKKLDRAGCFDHINSPESWWWGVQVKHGPTPTMKNQRRQTAVDLLIYLLGGFYGEMERIEELKEAAITDRTTAAPNVQIIGFDGKPTKREEFELPSPV